MNTRELNYLKILYIVFLYNVNNAIKLFQSQQTKSAAGR